MTEWHYCPKACSLPGCPAPHFITSYTMRGPVVWCPVCEEEAPQEEDEDAAAD